MGKKQRPKSQASPTIVHKTLVVEDKGHSPVGASSRYRWRACPGSVNLCRNLPPGRESEAAREGTEAHEVAAIRLKTGVWPKACTKEMQDHLQVYIDAVEKVLATLEVSHADENLYLVEHGFSLTQLHPDAWGTADAVIYDAFSHTLYVYDLKYGQGIFVDAIDNEQLQYYAVGAFLSLDLPISGVVLKIVQPRFENGDGGIREQRFTSEKLLEYAHEIETEIKATDNPEAPLRSGDHCRFCTAAGICPQLHKESQLVTKNIFAPSLPYDPEKLAATLEKLPMLEAFIKQVREFAYNEALSGRIPPNHKLVAKRPTRSFKDGRLVEQFLIANLASSSVRECYTSPDLKSPAQIEKILPKNLHLNLAEFIEAKSSGNKLVHVSENGEPIQLNDAKTIFGDISDGT